MLVVPAGCWLVALRKESVDRNKDTKPAEQAKTLSLSARRAWIEIDIPPNLDADHASLSARRAWIEMICLCRYAGHIYVALRKESVDRNQHMMQQFQQFRAVALRKESVDRNNGRLRAVQNTKMSLSARRAWIEI